MFSWRFHPRKLIIELLRSDEPGGATAEQSPPGPVECYSADINVRTLYVYMGPIDLKKNVLKFWLKKSNILSSQTVYLRNKSLSGFTDLYCNAESERYAAIRINSTEFE